MSKKQKKYYYVVVCHDTNKLRFVTKVDNENRTCEWTANKGEKPYPFYSWDDANYVCLGLGWRGTWAFPVVMPYELDRLPYNEIKEEKEG